MHSSLRRLSAYVAVPVMAGAVTLTTAGSASAVGPPQRAVVMLTGGAVSAPGVRILARLDSLHLELVEASPYALRVLAATKGVAGITPDMPIRFLSKDTKSGKDATGKDATGKDAGGKDKAKKNDFGVYASDGLGARAGKDGTGAGVDVAVIDTGVSDMPSLNRASGRLIDDVDTSGLVDGGEVVENGVFDDGYGHGTFMANVIAGGRTQDSNKNIGVAPGARVHVVKVANDAGEATLMSVLAGLHWVATHADTIEVANLALGAERPMPLYGPDPLNVAAEWLRAAGVNVVVASGNTAGEVSDPGFTPGVLTVGAADVTTSRGTVAAFSGSAIVAGVQKPDVVASGVNVLGVVPADSLIGASLTPAGGLHRGTGTSQSAAIVSGLAAIYLEANPGADTAEVKSSIRGAATAVPGAGAGAGLVQATTRSSAAAGDGESALDVAVWESGAFSGPDFGMHEWMGDLAGVWFGDSAAGDEWLAMRWSGMRWSTMRWSTMRWSGMRWSTMRWSGMRWSGMRWSGWSWTGMRWSGMRWSGMRWSTDTFAGAGA